MRKVLALSLLLALTGCPGGFQSSPNAGPGKQGGPTPPPPPPTPIPPPVPPQPPTGGNISCSSMPGRFHNAQEILDYANRTGDLQTCITLNNTTIRTGFGPCNNCMADGYVPPPNPNPTPQPPPPPGPPPPPPPPAPPGAPLPPVQPPEKSVSCRGLPGDFADGADVLKYLERTRSTDSCVTLDGQALRLGSEPCIVCTSNGFVPPGPHQ